ncbi:hypothetical protein GCK72_013327 [Caenorhabditis remanei]|uniref:RING-type domain-containing protein n=1 Tax=Caenorhabditis remanei TaxID=31234 RepID=A0A6A5GQK2_CAERE|nr:hypothetical protein GCK72_013327 [Caenorhabditis remanei]KAF1756873.1 hypothetical protein GCK72_013327 [Caenorhabditis remanei]
MSMLSSVFCLKCKNMYDLETRKMCIGTCNHSICEKCFDKKLTGTCPICEKGNSFDLKNINYQAQEMVGTVVQSVSLTDLVDLKLNQKYSGDGECSECKKYNEKLRVCVECAMRSELLTKSKDGDFEFSSETKDGELLETKMLLVRSFALCANCVLDGNKHDGSDGKQHKLIPMINIKGMSETSYNLRAISIVSFALHNIKKELSECKHMTLAPTVCAWVSEGWKTIEEFEQKIAEGNGVDHASNSSAVITMINTVMEILNGVSWVYKEVVEKCLADLSVEMNNAESVDEKRELKKTLEKLESLRNFYGSRKKFDLRTSKIVDLFYMYQSGTLGKTFANDNRIDKSSIEEAVRDGLNVTNDVRRMIKLPPRYEKYANFAGSCLQLFMREKSNQLEEPDLD